MVKKTLGVLLATLMLLPAGAFAAPSAAQLEKQVQMLAEQLEEMRAQLEEVQEAADYNTDSVEMLETSAEKWDAASRIQFSGDYRFRLDYSDTFISIGRNYEDTENHQPYSCGIVSHHQPRVCSGSRSWTRQHHSG
jgi:DNA-binding transcriptional MerR regulator